MKNENLGILEERPDQMGMSNYFKPYGFLDREDEPLRLKNSLLWRMEGLGIL